MNRQNAGYKIGYEKISPWRILQFYHVYRFGLSLILLTFNFVETSKIWVGKPDLRLYLYTTIFYMVINILFSILTQFKKPSFNILTLTSFIVEITLTMILIHASGGSLSWISFLLIITVAVSCILLPGITSYFLTTLAVAGLLCENLINSNFNYNDIGFPFVSTLGTILVILTLVTNLISRRARYNEALAEQRGAELATMEQLNAHIVSAIRIGVIIIDNKNDIRLINSAARYMLGYKETDHPKTLNNLPLKFQAAYSKQKLTPEESSSFTATKDSAEIRIVLKNLSDNLLGGTLVFIHDVAKERQRAEILKLKSLDRLAANIAHEIRNPLNAISHASQLLNEAYADEIKSSPKTQADSEKEKTHERLLGIITSHCARVNNIIQSIQILSKRTSSLPIQFNLEEELNHIVKELEYTKLAIHQDISKKPLFNQIRIDCTPKDLLIEFDKGQFFQIMLNLCENGIRYSEKATGVPELKIRAEHYNDLRETHIDIIDKGPGPSDELIAFLFDPFFTTETSGSGLGLYISKELCLANGSRLNFVRQSDGSSSFRLIIPDGAGDLINE